jgi:hypothetical protein
MKQPTMPPPSMATFSSAHGSLAQSVETDMRALRANGAVTLHPIAWHYIEVLAQRARAQNGPAQPLIYLKLQQRLSDIGARLKASAQNANAATASDQASAGQSPLARLLRDMQHHHDDEPAPTPIRFGNRHAEHPVVQEFRQQLDKIRVQKKVSEAIAQAPQNAGPINSHMLVLRSLGLMRDTSADYLSRFMTHVDTLLSLDAAQIDRHNTIKNQPGTRRPQHRSDSVSNSLALQDARFLSPDRLKIRPRASTPTRRCADNAMQGLPNSHE